jgi:chromosome segregation ATPase
MKDLENFIIARGPNGSSFKRKKNSSFAASSGKTSAASESESDVILETFLPMKRVKVRDNQTGSGSARHEINRLKEKISKLEDEVATEKAKREHYEEKAQTLEGTLKLWRRAFDKDVEGKRQAQAEAKEEREKYTALKAKVNRWLTARRRKASTFGDLIRAVSNDSGDDEVDARRTEPRV